MSLREKTQQLNHDLLGPIFYRFCYKLYLGQRCQPQEDTCLLFLSRGGIRLRAFYEAFLNANGLESPLPYDDFYVSRMALIKASLHCSYELVAADFLAEYAYFTINDAIQAFLQPDQYDEWVNRELDLDITQHIDRPLLDQIIWGEGEGAEYLRRVLDEERLKYQRYVSETVGSRKNLMVIDTGWSGSILRYMQGLDSKRDYTALFFGRYNYGKPDPTWFSQVVGVEVQHPDFDRRFPITSIFLNRHLIEGLCEIRWPSVTGYRCDSENQIEPYERIPPESSVLPDDEEPHAMGVLQYIKEAPGGMNYEAIYRNAERAAKQLCRRLMYPRRQDLPLLSVPTRSADFGKNLDVPFFAEPATPFFRVRTKLRQSKNSLWQSGQLVLEFGLLGKAAQFLYHRRKRIVTFLSRMRVL